MFQPTSADCVASPPIYAVSWSSLDTYMRTPLSLSLSPPLLTHSLTLLLHKVPVLTAKSRYCFVYGSEFASLGLQLHRGCRQRRSPGRHVERFPSATEDVIVSYLANVQIHQLRLSLAHGHTHPAAMGGGTWQGLLLCVLMPPEASSLSPSFLLFVSSILIMDLDPRYFGSRCGVARRRRPGPTTITTSIKP